MEKLKIEIKKLNKDVIMPSYAHKTDAGMDIYANWTYDWYREWHSYFDDKYNSYIYLMGYDRNYFNRNDDKIIILQNKIMAIPTGIAINIPKGYECQVRMKSGLALKHGLMLVNSIGTIDSGYQGEIKIILTNIGQKDYILEKNTKIAQLVFNKIERAELETVIDFSDISTRGEKGFGSTGII